MAGARKETEAPRGLNVALLAGGFPSLYEHSLLAEIAAVARQKVACRVLALFPSGRALPESFDGLPIAVEYLGSDSLTGALAANALGLPGELFRRPRETLRHPRMVRWRARLRACTAKRDGGRRGRPRLQQRVAEPTLPAPGLLRALSPPTRLPVRALALVTHFDTAEFAGG